MTPIRSLTLAGMALAILAGCAPRGNEAPRLMNLTSAQRGPDEFSILPTQPLQAPPDFRTLPTPTPGAPNLVDSDPRADAARALGGTLFPAVAVQDRHAADALRRMGDDGQQWLRDRPSMRQKASLASMTAPSTSVM